MVYSNTRYYMDTPPEHFPPPPMFMTLIVTADKGEAKGQIRHHEDLEKVKKYLAWIYRYQEFVYTRDPVTQRWVRSENPAVQKDLANQAFKVFEWKVDHYELLFSAEKGDHRDKCLLMAKTKRIAKRKKPAEQHEVDQAIASILISMEVSS